MSEIEVCSDGGMVDTQDLKSCDHCGCAGSSPAPSTMFIKGFQLLIRLRPFLFWAALKTTGQVLTDNKNFYTTQKEEDNGYDVAIV